MKKTLALALILVCALGLFACAQKEYKVEFAGNYLVVNSVKDTYAPGEEVTVKLPIVTESYYVFYVNGVVQERDPSDLEFLSYTFTMPSEDVLITIEAHDVVFPSKP